MDDREDDRDLSPEMKAWMDQFNGPSRFGTFKVPATNQNYRFMRALTEGSLLHSSHDEFRAVVCNGGCCLSMVAASETTQANADLIAYLQGDAAAERYLRRRLYKGFVTSMC